MQTESNRSSFYKLPAEKQDRILQAAVSEFAEYGYDSANINRIAQNAGVSIGSMYNYFTGKQDLYLTVVHLGVETLKTALEEIIGRETDLFRRIEEIIKAIQSHSRRYARLTRLYNEMTTESNSELTWAAVSEMEGVTAALYASFIEQSQQAGLVRPDVDPRYFAFFLDNLFILLQFSYACDYYKNRLKLFVGEHACDDDQLMAEELMKFIKGAFGGQ